MDEPLSPLDHKAIKSLQDEYEKRLEVLKDTAGKWQAGLAAVLTGFSGLIVVTGRETFEDLNAEAQKFAGIWLGVAIMLSLAGGYFGLRAAAGWPRNFNLRSAMEAAQRPGDIFVAINSWKEGLHKKSKRHLVYSLVATYAAVGFLFMALVVTWYSPEAKPAPEANCVSITSDGEELAQWSIDGGSITLTGPSGQLELKSCE